jgi:hypothetical protein
MQEHCACIDKGAYLKRFVRPQEDRSTQAKETNGAISDEDDLVVDTAEIPEL